MIPLHTLKVASPCHADWDAMEGDDQARFCGTCRKNVYNLSEMTHEEAQALVSRLEGRLCVRFYTRADGTLLTQDCPVGLRAVRRKLARKLSYAAALLLSCASGQTARAESGPGRDTCEEALRQVAYRQAARRRAEPYDGQAHPATHDAHDGDGFPPASTDGGRSCRQSGDPPLRGKGGE